MVLEIARLWFYITPYSRKNKYESRHPIKKGSGRYQGQQQRCLNAERRNLGKTADNSRYQNDMKETSGRRNYFTRRNTIEWN